MPKQTTPTRLSEGAELNSTRNRSFQSLSGQLTALILTNRLATTKTIYKRTHNEKQKPDKSDPVKKHSNWNLNRQASSLVRTTRTSVLIDCA